MKNKDCLRWLHGKGLTDTAKKCSNHLEKVFKDCLAVDQEKVMILGDSGTQGRRLSALLSCSYYITAKRLGLNADIYLQDIRHSKKKVVSREVIHAMEKLPLGSVMIFSLSNKLGKLKGLTKSFRNYSRRNFHRFISTTSLGNVPTNYVDHFIAALDIDYPFLRRRQKKLKKILDNGKEIRIKTRAGTDISFDISEYEAISSDGNFRQPRTGGNIPAGEVFIAPVEGSGEGTVVIDASSRNSVSTVLIQESPVKIWVKRGKIVKISGGIEARMLEDSIRKAEKRAKFPKNVRKIGEIGIGMNPRARILGTTIIDEKVAGTAHIAVGSNYWFGGSIRTILHLDQVFRDPFIFVDSRLLKFRKFKNH